MSPINLNGMAQAGLKKELPDFFGRARSGLPLPQNWFSDSVLSWLRVPQYAQCSPYKTLPRPQEVQVSFMKAGDKR